MKHPRIVSPHKRSRHARCGGCQRPSGRAFVRGRRGLSVRWPLAGLLCDTSAVQSRDNREAIEREREITPFDVAEDDGSVAHTRDTQTSPRRIERKRRRGACIGDRDAFGDTANERRVRSETQTMPIGDPLGNTCNRGLLPSFSLQSSCHTFSLRSKGFRAVLLRWLCVLGCLLVSVFVLISEKNA